jgi:hypothetical protein
MYGSSPASPKIILKIGSIKDNAHDCKSCDGGSIPLLACGNNLTGRMLICGISCMGSSPISHLATNSSVGERVAVNYKVIGSIPIWVYV